MKDWFLVNLDTILAVFGYIWAIIATLVGGYLYKKMEERAGNRPLKSILNLGEDDIIFVFSHRDEAPGAILPRVATEDFMAMNNFISALLKIKWNGKLRVKDTNQEFSLEDSRKNIVTFCSSKTNTFTRQVEEDLKEKYGRTENSFFRFVKDPSNDGRWMITDGAANYPSKSYEQRQDYIAKGVEKEELAKQEYDDVAIITKITNPNNGVNKIFVIAGVRGIGTWGAAECIKKEWQQIYDLLGNRKKGDFSAIALITYKGYDIVGIRVHSVRMLN